LEAGVLTLRDVSVSYGISRAVTGVDLTVQPGEFVALVGANGAGKTSLLRAVSGVVRHTGSLCYADQDLDGRRVDEIIRLGITLVPQGRLLFPRMSVRDNLLAGALSAKTHVAHARADALEEQIDVLRTRRNQVTRTMSGGEQQLVAVARGLMANPRMLLLDEPSLGLAPIMIKRVMDIVAGQHRAGVSILLAEQNVAMARQYAQRLVVMRQGRIVMDVPTQGTTTESVIAAYLGGEATPSP
jgi:branched-chain amino acid transport system ATP-binding protein